MLSVNGVTKIYESKNKLGWFRSEKKQKVAVENLSIKLYPGEIIGLLGLNGAGKTTTIKMISTLLEPTSGSITIDGLDTVKNRQSILEKINMIAGGERMLYWRLTGRENLMYFGRLYGLAEKEIISRSEVLLEEMGLKDAADTPVENYSKGMKQRLQIARGLINDPDYLLMDEPTLGLDAPIARQLRKTVKRLAVESGKGILLTSHYLQEVEELCDRVYVIDKGELIMCATPSEVVKKAARYETLHLHIQDFKEERLDYLNHFLNIPESDISLVRKGDQSGVLLSIKTDSVDDLTPAILPWLMKEGVQIKNLTVEKPTLEDAIVLLSEGGLRDDDKILAGVSS
ncbi:ABC transporter ATP-binding protein [Rossellomorea sp. NS-SX7]|uniref:ABC transporter ATP-binding protein n=1 Tax=Rossellomorea sp. NS-SX7 TaxID=3463856 RepID=UPI004058DB6A